LEFQKLYKIGALNNCGLMAKKNFSPNFQETNKQKKTSPKLVKRAKNLIVKEQVKSIEVTLEDPQTLQKNSLTLFKSILIVSVLFGIVVLGFVSIFGIKPIYTTALQDKNADFVNKISSRSQNVQLETKNITNKFFLSATKDPVTPNEDVYNKLNKLEKDLEIIISDTDKFSGQVETGLLPGTQDFAKITKETLNKYKTNNQNFQKQLKIKVCISRSDFDFREAGSKIQDLNQIDDNSSDEDVAKTAGQVGDLFKKLAEVFSRFTNCFENSNNFITPEIQSSATNLATIFNKYADSFGQLSGGIKSSDKQGLDKINQDLAGYSADLNKASGEFQVAVDEVTKKLATENLKYEVEAKEFAGEFQKKSKEIRSKEAPFFYQK